MYVGIDVGGTNLKAGLVDETGRILAVERTPLDFQGPEAFAATLAELSRAVMTAGGAEPAQVEYVGVGLPGAVSGGDVVYTTNIPMENVPLEALFRHTLDLPLLLGNDADCAAVGEFFCGAGRGEQLVLLMSFAREAGTTPLVVGNGTNLLVSDRGLDRLVIDTSAGLSRVEAGGTPGTILAEAGASLARVADFACRQGLAGLEFAHGIPGTVGGAVCMNAGAYGGEMAQVVREATLLLPEEGIRTLTGAEMAFGYRRSFLTDHPDAVVLRAEFCLTPGDPAAIRGRMKELLEKRRASQPLEFPSAGSTFKRPEGYYAGTLIDQCGLKGLTVGGAQVSEKHAGFVINRGGATCADVKELIRQIQERVFAQAGVRLEPEVRIID